METIGSFVKRLRRFGITALLCLVACCLVLPGCSDKKGSKSQPYGAPPPIPKEEKPPATQPVTTDAPAQH